MDDDSKDLRRRTRAFSNRIIRLFRSLSKANPTRTIADQLLRSGLSVGAHYAEAYRAKSRLDFISKIVGATQELEETEYWVCLLIDSGAIEAVKLESLQQEMSELMSIFVTMVKHTKENSPE